MVFQELCPRVAALEAGEDCVPSVLKVLQRRSEIKATAREKLKFPKNHEYFNVSVDFIKA